MLLFVCPSYLKKFSLLLGCLAAIVCGFPQKAAMSESALELEHIMQAARKGEAHALFRIGELHETGNSVPHDLSMAMVYMRLAAERGDSGASYRLGMGLASGTGIPRDLIDSYKWLSLAQAADPENDVGLLAEMMREAVARLMSSEEIVQAKARLSRFRPVIGPVKLPNEGKIGSSIVGSATPVTIEDMERRMPSTGCGPISVARSTNGALRVSALVPAGRKLDILGNVTAVLDRTTVVPNLTEIDRKICDAIDVLAARPIWLDDGPDVVLRDESGRSRDVFTEASFLVVEVPGMRGARFLTIDYFSHDGQVLHMFPDGPNQDNFQPAGKRLVLGSPGRGGKEWQIGPPFGSDLVSVIASRRPVHRGTRPMVENTLDYLKFLEKRLSDISNGAVVEIRYRVVQTIARPR